MNLESIDLDRLETALIEHGAQSVTLTDAGNDPVLEPAPGEMPLWQDTTVTALFGADTDFDLLRRDLRSTLELEQLPPSRIERLADRDWEREWLARFAPMRFGRRLWVLPGDAEVPADDAVIVRLDPGLAFGTGTHATTALCLEWLEQIDLAGRTVCDFGCGSGILGIAALKLGAESVEAIDNDLQAITATRQNAQRNGVEKQLRATTIPSEPPRQFDVVVANILANTLIQNAEFIGSMLKPGGQLALCGILASQIGKVKAGFRDWSIDFASPVFRDGWVRLSGIRD
jgi:ribosomal protein L11 methyltransferase